MNPKTLQYIMGHSDISVTLDTYTHLGFDEAADEMKRVAGNNLWGKRKRITSIFTSFKYYKMLSYTSFCKEKIYNIFLIKPVLIGIWEHLKGNKKLWQKSYLSATAVFNGCCESLGFKGFFDDWRIIYTLFIPLEDRIGIIEK